MVKRVNKRSSPLLNRMRAIPIVCYNGLGFGHFIVLDPDNSFYRGLFHGGANLSRPHLLHTHNARTRTRHHRCSSRYTAMGTLCSRGGVSFLIWPCYLSISVFQPRQPRHRKLPQSKKVPLAFGLLRENFNEGKSGKVVNMIVRALTTKAHHK